MSPASLTTARIMETWAHGVDMRDALGVQTAPSPRLRHVCHIGYQARPYAFFAHGVADPGDPVRLEVRSPDRSEWTWCPEDTANRITGSALNVSLVSTQPRHHSRTGVRATGRVAAQWLDIAQAFARPGTVPAQDR